MDRDQGAQPGGDVGQGGAQDPHVVGGGGQQRSRVAEPVDAAGEVLQVLAVDLPASLGLPGVGAVLGNDVPEDFLGHGASKGW